MPHEFATLWIGRTRYQACACFVDKEHIQTTVNALMTRWSAASAVAVAVRLADSTHDFDDDPQDGLSGAGQRLVQLLLDADECTRKNTLLACSEFVFSPAWSALQDGRLRGMARCGRAALRALLCAPAEPSPASSGIPQQHHAVAQRQVDNFVPIVLPVVGEDVGKAPSRRFKRQFKPQFFVRAQETPRARSLRRQLEISSQPKEKKKKKGKKATGGFTESGRMPFNPRVDVAELYEGKVRVLLSRYDAGTMAEGLLETLVASPTRPHYFVRLTWMCVAVLLDQDPASLSWWSIRRSLLSLGRDGDGLEPQDDDDDDDGHGGGGGNKFEQPKRSRFFWKSSDLSGRRPARRSRPFSAYSEAFSSLTASEYGDSSDAAAAIMKAVRNVTLDALTDEQVSIARGILQDEEETLQPRAVAEVSEPLSILLVWVMITVNVYAHYRRGRKSKSKSKSMSTCHNKNNKPRAKAAPMRKSEAKGKDKGESKSKDMPEAPAKPLVPVPPPMPAHHASPAFRDAKKTTQSVASEESSTAGGSLGLLEYVQSHVNMNARN